MKKLYNFKEGSYIYPHNCPDDVIKLLVDYGYPVKCDESLAALNGLVFTGTHWRELCASDLQVKNYSYKELVTKIERFGYYNFHSDGRWIPSPGHGILNINPADSDNWFAFIRSYGYSVNSAAIKDVLGAGPHGSIAICLDDNNVFRFCHWKQSNFQPIDIDEFRGLIDGSNHIFRDNTINGFPENGFDQTPIHELGIINKYRIEKTDGSPMPEGGEYFVLRLDQNQTDKRHQEACRKALIKYATEIQDHLPALSDDIFERYGVAEKIECSVIHNQHTAIPASEKPDINFGGLPTYWLVQATTENVISELWHPIKWSVFASYPHMMEAPILTDHYIGIDKGKPIVISPEASELKRFTILTPKEWRELASMPASERNQMDSSDKSNSFNDIIFQLLRSDLRKKEIDIAIAERRLEREIAGDKLNIPDETTLVVKTIDGKSVEIDGHTIKDIFRYFEQDHKPG